MPCKLTDDDFTKLTNTQYRHRAREFGRQGCTVYATSRRVETIGDFCNPNIHRLALDVTSDEDVQRVIQQIVSREGKIDVVVNNAGIICPGKFFCTKSEGRCYADESHGFDMQDPSSIIPWMT